MGQITSDISQTTHASSAPLVGSAMRHLVRSVLAVVPLADALAVFSEFIKDRNESAAAMLAVATLRGEEAKPLIESRSGASNSTEEAGERLKKNPETVRNWVEQGRLIGYRAAGDRTRIRLPVWQFDEHGVQPWVASLVAAYGANGWSLLDFVTVPRSSLGGTPYLHRLLSGHEADIAEVIAAARRTNPA